MIAIRPIKYPEDYQTLMGWWTERGKATLDRAIFPGTGAVAEDTGCTVAMSFLYLDVGGAFAMIEWTSTNPKCAFSRGLLEAVKSLYLHLEGVARARGCLCITSMVDPAGSERRIMEKMGYQSQTENDPHHVMYAKPLMKEAACPQSR